MVLSTIWCR